MHDIRGKNSDKKKYLYIHIYEYNYKSKNLKVYLKYLIKYYRYRIYSIKSKLFMITKLHAGSDERLFLFWTMICVVLLMHVWFYYRNVSTAKKITVSL